MNPEYSVLLVEDNPDDAGMVRALLTRAEGAVFRLENASALEQGLSMLEEETFDAVLLDLGLPDSQGIDTFLRLHASAPEVPALVLTGQGDRDLALLAIRNGAHDYLVKSDSRTAVLPTLLRLAIEGARARAAATASELRYRRLFEAAKDGILIVDASDGTVTDANPFLLDLLGYNYHEVVGAHLWDLGPFRNIAANREKFV